MNEMKNREKRMYFISESEYIYFPLQVHHKTYLQYTSDNRKKQHLLVHSRWFYGEKTKMPMNESFESSLSGSGFTKICTDMLESKAWKSLKPRHKGLYLQYIQINYYDKMLDYELVEINGQ